MDVEDRGQNLDVGGRKSEVRRKTTDDGRQRTEGLLVGAAFPARLA
jgi:hypothetical protein